MFIKELRTAVDKINEERARPAHSLYIYKEKKHQIRDTGKYL
jgi:hypothetical protein